MFLSFASSWFVVPSEYPLQLERVVLDFRCLARCRVEEEMTLGGELPTAELVAPFWAPQSAGSRLHAMRLFSGHYFIRAT